MNRKMILLAVMAVALATLACTVTLPTAQVKTGPTVTEDIHVPFLADKQATADVTLKFGAGNFNLQPGAVNDLISGTVKYNVTDIKPVITTDNNNISIEQGNLKLTGIPIINQDIVNDWNLTLANSPMSLVINAGAYKGTYELGGLSIHKLEVTDGAANVQMGFSKPNQVEMTSLSYNTGASDVSISGLGNANATQMDFHSGAGNYTLDFSGQLTRDMAVSIDSGVSSVTIIVPTGTSVKLTTEGSLVTITKSGSWEQNGNVYQVTGSGYTITITAKLGAGSLQLQTK